MEQRIRRGSAHNFIEIATSQYFICHEKDNILATIHSTRKEVITHDTVHTPNKHKVYGRTSGTHEGSKQANRL